MDDDDDLSIAMTEDVDYVCGCCLTCRIRLHLHY